MHSECQTAWNERRLRVTGLSDISLPCSSQTWQMRSHSEFGRFLKKSMLVIQRTYLDSRIGPWKYLRPCQTLCYRHNISVATEAVVHKKQHSVAAELITFTIEALMRKRWETCLYLKWLGKVSFTGIMHSKKVVFSSLVRTLYWH